MKDPRQGAAASVFLVFYVLAFVFTVFCLFTRRGKRHIFCVFSFNLIRVGANVASLGWAIHLYDNTDWLVASLILGTEGESAGKSIGTPLTSTRLLCPRSRYPVSHLFKSHAARS
jgi:cobalamin synthase